MFKLEGMTIGLIEVLRPVVTKIAREDRNLADQLRRAASSIGLNVSESAYARGGNRKALLSVAAGSANESRAALRVARAWGYVGEVEMREVEARVDQVITVLWKLTH
jgi:four helix bundle protein